MSLSDLTAVRDLTTADRRQAVLGCTLGGALTILVALISAFLGAGGVVSDDLYRAPLSREEFIAISILAAATHVIVLMGIVALRRSRAAGAASRIAGGLAVAAAGTLTLAAMEVANLSLQGVRDDDPLVAVIGAGYGIATLLTIGGLTAAGLAARTEGRLAGWRRNAILVCAALSLCVLPFTFAAIVWPGIVLLGSGYVILGTAVRDPSIP